MKSGAVKMMPVNMVLSVNEQKVRTTECCPHSTFSTGLAINMPAKRLSGGKEKKVV